jgi:hypothetical protein
MSQDTKYVCAPACRICVRRLSHCPCPSAIERSWQVFLTVFSLHDSVEDNFDSSLVSFLFSETIYIYSEPLPSLRNLNICSRDAGVCAVCPPRAEARHRASRIVYLGPCPRRIVPSRIMANIITLEFLQTLLVHNLAAVHRLHFVDVAYALGASYAVLKVLQVTRRRLKTTALRGPSNPSFVWGFGKALLMSPDSGAVYEKWMEEYGGVYEVPLALGGRRIVLCDPKAIAHFYGGEPWTYILTPFGKIATENVVSGYLRMSLIIVSCADQGFTGRQGEYIVRKGRRSP